MTTDYLLQSSYKDDINHLDKFRKMIAVCAYYKAEKRGFSSGHEIDDWLEAEQEVNKQYFYLTQEEW